MQRGVESAGNVENDNYALCRQADVEILMLQSIPHLTPLHFHHYSSPRGLNQNQNEKVMADSPLTYLVPSSQLPPVLFSNGIKQIARHSCVREGYLHR